MLEKAKHIIRQQISQRERILVGLSGGADSIVLAHLLYCMGYKLFLVHINFQLRGEESDRDEAFVAQFITDQMPDVPYHFATVNTEQRAAAEGISIEMAARDLRYALFEELRIEHQCDWIAVGHHANDQVETALLNLSRGTGGKGLAGMKVTNQRIIRPFLITWKSELLDYLSSHQLSYVTDSSNFDLSIKRNYIRHQLIPDFEELNPSFTQTVLETMEHLREEQEALEEGEKQFVQRHLNKQEMSIALTDIEMPYFLKRWLWSYGFTHQQAESIVANWDNPKTISFEAPSARIEIYRGKLYLITGELSSFIPTELTSEWIHSDIGMVKWGAKGTLTLRLSDEYLHKQIILRMGRKEDRFTPYGMKQGSKELFRYLGEKGLPEYYRPFCPVLESEGEIIAVLPFEVSETAKYHHIERSMEVGFVPGESPFGAIVAQLSSNMGRNK